MSNVHQLKTQNTVTAINAFNDNYIWALANGTNDKIALIDQAMLAFV